MNIYFDNKTEAGFQTSFAASELKDYLQTLLGVDFQQVPQENEAELIIRLRTDATIGGPDDFTIQSVPVSTCRCHVLTGSSPLALLYAVYRYLEEWGVRFALHGDRLPTSETIRFPDVLDIREQPAFGLRGLNSWGAHALGLDSWDEADFRKIFGQMAKLRMNFFGVHTYPEGLNYTNTHKTPEGEIIHAEPWVWIGDASMIEEDGTVNQAYPAALYNTGVFRPWADTRPTQTDSYPFGADSLFQDAIWSSDIIAPNAPAPESDEDCCALFNRMGSVLQDVFSWANALGIKTCLGTEAPLRVPERIRGKSGPLSPDEKRRYYRGIFERIRRTHPLDYFWIWTPENWTWDMFSEEDYQIVVEEIRLADEILTEMGRPFELATAGWVLGPEGDRQRLHHDIPKHIPMSSIFRKMGLTPMDPTYTQIEGRPLWAIPWIESDGGPSIGMQAIQLEVGRTLYDARDARDAGCEGLMGLHWRTHEVDPVTTALAQGAWGHGLDEPVMEDIPQERDDFSIYPRALCTKNFYQRFASAEFGTEADKEIADILSEWDGNQIELLSAGCPTNSLHSGLSIETNVQRSFRPLTQLQQLKPRVVHPVHAARLDYWLGMFEQEKHLAETCFALSQLEDFLRYTTIENEEQTQKGIQLYTKTMDTFGRAVTRLMEVADSPGAVGMVVNLMANAYMLRFIRNKGDALKTAIDAAGFSHLELPDPDAGYSGKAKIKVWSPPTYEPAHRPLTLNIHVLSDKEVKQVRCLTHPCAEPDSETVFSANHLSRRHWQVLLPATEVSEIYRIEAELHDGTRLHWPEDNPGVRLSRIPSQRIDG